MRFAFFTALLLAFCPNHGKVVSAVVPGYLDFDNLPDTNFSCDGKVIGGYYADVETGCQMFHVCTIGQKGEITDIKFLCLNGTVFDQETRVCERVDEVDCSKTEGFYDLNLELYGNNAALSYHETEEDPVTIPAVSSTPSTTTTTTSTTTTTIAPTTASQLSLGLGLGLGRTPASTHYSSTPSPSLAAALLSVHSALSRDRHPHLTVQGGGSSGVLNPADAFHSLKTSVEPQQLVSPLHYQHIFTTPSIAVVSSTRSVSSVKSVVGKPGDGPAPAEVHSRVPINNFAFGINTGLNLAQFSGENATQHDQYDEYREVDGVSLDPFFRDVPRIAKQSKRQKRATGRGGRGRFRPSLEALREESEEEEPSPEASEVFPQEAVAPRMDEYFQKRRRGRPEALREESGEEGSSPEGSEVFLQEAVDRRVDDYFQKRRHGRPEPLREESVEGPSPEGSEVFLQEAVDRRVDNYFQKRRRGRPDALREKSVEGPSPEGSEVFRQEAVARRVDNYFQKRHHGRSEALREGSSEEGPSPEGSEVFPQEVVSHRVDDYSQKRRRGRPQQDVLPTEEALPTADAFFRSTAIGRLQQVVTTAEPSDVQTTTPTTETTSKFRGSGRRTAAGSSGPVTSRRAVECRRGGRTACADQRSPYRRRPEPFAPQTLAAPQPTAAPVIGSRQRDRAPSTITQQQPAASPVAVIGNRQRDGAPTTTTQQPPQTPAAPQPTAAALSGSRQRERAPSTTTLQQQAAAPVVVVGSRQRERAPSTTTQQQLAAAPVAVVGSRQRQRAPSTTTQQQQAATPVAVVGSRQRERASSTTTQQPPVASPETSFSCADKVPGGYYADVEADCQLFHICSQGRHGRITDNKFMCGPGTRFNQRSRTCQVGELVDCSISTSLYHLNNHFQLEQQEDLNDEPGFELLKVRRSKREAKGAARSPDYTVDNLPETSFTCEDKASEGLYADVETQCQGFHLCQKMKGVMTLVSTFVCPHKTVFNQYEGNCDNWADVDCSLYSQPEHSFDRKSSRKHSHTKRDTSPILKTIDFSTYSNGDSDNWPENISAKIHSFISRSDNNTTNTPKAADPLVRYTKRSKKSNIGHEFEQTKGRKWLKLDRKLYIQPTTSLPHKRIKHDVSDESNETEEEYYDYIDDSYEADLLPPEEDNSSLTSHNDTSQLKIDYNTHSRSSTEKVDIVTTHLAPISINELLVLKTGSENDTDTKGTITTLPTVSSSTENYENDLKVCAENETCSYKDELLHTGKKDGTIASYNHDHNIEAPQHSTEEPLVNHESNNNNTSAPDSDEYDYFDYYIEDIEDDSDGREKTTLSSRAYVSEPPPLARISNPHTLYTSSEESKSSTTESIVSDIVVAGSERNESNAQNKHQDFPAVVSEENFKNTLNKRFESSSETATSEDYFENNKDRVSERIPVTHVPEIIPEGPISTTDEKYDYYDTASDDEAAQLVVTYKEVLNTNFATTEKLQKGLSEAKKEINMYQHSTETANEAHSYEEVTDVTVTQISGIKHFQLPEVANVHEERTYNFTTIPTLLNHGHNTDTDMFSVTNASLEYGFPNTSTNDQNLGNLISENTAQINMSTLAQHMTIDQRQPTENNNSLQDSLQSDGKESDKNTLSESITPHTTSTQATTTTQIPNLFHPPKPHRAYHGRHSSPVLPPVVIRSKDGGTHKPRSMNNRHKTKKTQIDEIQTTTEIIIKSENESITSESDNYFSTGNQQFLKKDEVTSGNSIKNAGNNLLVPGTTNEFKVEQKTEPVFQQDTFTPYIESITVLPSAGIVFGQAVSENVLRVNTDGLDSCKGNSNCPQMQSQYTTLSSVNQKFYDKHNDRLPHVSQSDGLLSDRTEKNIQQPNSLEQSTLRIFKGTEERQKVDEPVLGTDTPPTASGNALEYITITPKVQTFEEDASDTATTESPYPTYTLSAIHSQNNQNSNQDISRFVCSGKVLYRYYQDPLDCRIFHYCSHGFHNQQVLDFRFMCENGTAFSIDTQKCENEDKVQSCSMNKK